MRNYNRNLLMVMKNNFLNEQAIEQEMDCLNEVLAHTETPRQFCLAHELVNRNSITQKARKILKASNRIHLPAFRFLINKN